MGYLGATLTQVLTRVGGADVSIRDVTIAQMGNGARECGWRHAPEARGGFGGFWKSQLSWELNTEREGSSFGARRGQTNLRATDTARDRGQMEKNRKNVYLSPYVEEPLNSKVINSFVPELRSRKCFSCFGISMFYIYMLWTFYIRFPYPYLAMVQNNQRSDAWSKFFFPFFFAFSQPRGRHKYSSRRSR